AAPAAATGQMPAPARETGAFAPAPPPPPVPASQAAAPPPAATEDASAGRTPWRWLAAAALLIAGVALALARRRPDSRWSLPAWRTNATFGAVAITFVLMLKLGAWFPVGLIAVYAALDGAQRLRTRRDARSRMAPPAPVDPAPDGQRPAFVWRFQAGDAFERSAGYRPSPRVMFTPATGGKADASSSAERRN
ncbi:MAG: hypothetical protein ACM3YM_07985, partial [Sphingomonadales bacterium]